MSAPPVTQTVGRLGQWKIVFRSKPIGVIILLSVSLIAVIGIEAMFRWDLLFTGRNDYLEYTEYETQTDWNQSPSSNRIGFSH